jgi:hypothetical protein
LFFSAGWLPDGIIFHIPTVTSKHTIPSAHSQNPSSPVRADRREDGIEAAQPLPGPLEAGQEGAQPGSHWIGGESGYILNMAALQSLVPRKKIAAFCKHWKVVEFALFGSAVREDFSAQSDIDALVSFAPHSTWSLFDHVQMKQELQEIFGREVDLITRRALEQSHNTLLRSEILGTARTVYSEHEHANV